MIRIISLCAVSFVVALASACPSSVGNVRIKATVDGSEVEETLSFNVVKPNDSQEERFVSSEGFVSITLHHAGSSQILGDDVVMFITFGGGEAHVGTMLGSAGVQGSKNGIGIQTPWVEAWRFTGQDGYPIEIVLKMPQHDEANIDVLDYEIRLRPDCSSRIFQLPSQMCGGTAGDNSRTYEGTGVALPQTIPAELITPILGELEGKAVVFERGETLQIEGVSALDCARGLENNRRMCGAERSGLAFEDCNWTTYVTVVPFQDGGGRRLHFVANSIADDGCEITGPRAFQGVIDMPIVERE